MLNAHAAVGFRTGALSAPAPDTTLAASPPWPAGLRTAVNCDCEAWIGDRFSADAARPLSAENKISFACNHKAACHSELAIRPCAGSTWSPRNKGDRHPERSEGPLFRVERR